MNAYAKYVLIPQQEYARLKRPSKTTVILDSDQPKLIKRSRISRNFKFNEPTKVAHQIFGAQSKEEPDTSLEEIQASNLPDPVKNKLMEDLTEDFQPSQYSTPHGSFSGMLDSEATASGRLVDRRGNVVPKSNIKTVKDYLLSTEATKQPAGTQAALDILKNNPDLARRVRNPKARRKLNFDQVGSGWISIKKF